MSELRIPTAEVFEPLLHPSRYKGAHGGRGSGKSHFMAGNLVRVAMLNPGFRGVCIREVQKSLKESAKRLLEDKIQSYGVGQLFEVQEALIKTPGGGVIVFQGMQDHTSESVKSLEGFDVAWCEEAQSLSQRSLTLLRPTIRKPGSELWFSWNRTRKVDPVDVLLTQGSPPTDSIVVKANWSDNPWFPDVLDQERRDDQRDRPDQYDHVWEGDYAKVTEGAYFAKQLSEARKQGRIGRVGVDPLMQLRTFWDLGVNDSTAIWIAQFVGREIRVLDYIEGQGQPLSYYVTELRSRGMSKAIACLPHDGGTRDVYTAVKFEDHLRDAGFTVQVIKNQGKGAAMRRIETARRLFPRIWINEVPCMAGIDALGAYHERKDEARQVGLGPEHDWASHAADAFGLMCVAYTPPEHEELEGWRDEAGRSAVAGY